MIGLEAEWTAFVQAFFAGMIVCSGYSCIRKFRRVLRHNLIAVSIEDGLFWITAAIYLFVQIYYTSNGSIRWYFILGVVFGAIFFCVLQKRIKKITKKDKI